MAQEPKFTRVLNINLDLALAMRVRQYRFRKEFDTENQAFRELLLSGLKTAEGFFEKGPKKLISEARRLLRNAQPAVAWSREFGPEDLTGSPGKRINLDDETADRITRYKKRMRRDSVNQAFKDLLWLGLWVEEELQEAIWKAKKLLRFALEMQIGEAWSRGEALGSEHTDAVLSAIDNVFNEDGTLKGL